MKKKWYFIIGGAVILVIFFVLALKSSGSKKTNANVERASRGEITSIVTATGKVKAQADVQISAEVMGRIVQLPVKEGDVIKTGQLLVKLDSRSAEMDVAQARGALASARANLENMRVTLEREKGLFAKKLESQANLDLAQSNYDQAAAQGEISQANLDRAQDQLDKCTIHAPMDGVITKLNSELGENVVIGTMNAAGTVIMVISDLAKIEIEAQVDETDIANVGLGQDVKISLDAFPDTTFKGQVIEVGNSAQTSITGLTATDQVTNFLVKVLLQDNVPNIKPGMTASVDITTAHKSDIVKIPAGAVVMRPEGTEKEEVDPKGGKATNKKQVKEGQQFTSEFLPAKKDQKEIDGVFVIRGGRALFVPVRTGIRDQQNVEITSGLADSDSVITGPYRTLRIIKPGELINPQKPLFGAGSDSTRIQVN
jgi:HlyD family secretion protein